MFNRLFYATKRCFLAFTVDDNYAPFVPVTIESIKAHSNAKRDYKIFVLAYQVSSEHRNAIYASKTKNFDIQIIDVDELVKRENVNSFKTLKHITTATYYRFFLPSILKDYKKVVYLEADQILQADVAELFDTDLKGKSIGAIA